MSFVNTAQWASCFDAGRFHVTAFRKQVASAATAANDFIDYTYFAGNPVANFYASAPLEAAHVEANKGIFLRDVGKSQFIKDFCTMSAAGWATSTMNQNQRLTLCDYLMYYPFIDTDAVGEQQDMVQTVSLPRYNTEAVLGPELVVNGDFSDGTTGWALAQPTSGSVGVVDGALRINSIDGSFCYAQQTALTVGKRYRLTFTLSVAAGALTVSDGTSNYGTYASSGSQSLAFTASSVHLQLKRNSGVTDVSIDNISVREVISRGQGGQVMCVAQSASSTVGTFTLSYTNQDGVSGRTTQATFTKVVSGGGTIVTSSTNSVAGSLPFVNLQAGDTSVRSVESCTFSAAGGGLMAIVIVKPLFDSIVTQECRRTTTGNLDSYGAATHLESFIHQQTPEVKQGAVLGVVGLGNAGSLASSILTGVLTTQWSA